MIKINRQFKYEKLTRVIIDGYRFYEKDKSTQAMPSVTTVLSATQDNAHLDEWRERVGLQEANRITAEAAYVGEHLHTNLENYLLGNSTRTGCLMSKLLSDLIIKRGLCNLSEVWGIEAPVCNFPMYAGTADLFGIHSNDEAVIDFKNARSQRKDEWLTSYKAQAYAYADAHNITYGTNIKKCVIMMAVRDGTYHEYVYAGRAFAECKELWLRKLEDYYISQIQKNLVREL